jgi:threonyl-tRNA synthetase
MNNDKLYNIRHSLAHIMASAVMEMFPKANLGVGPVIDNGFYYDFLLPRPLTPGDMQKIEKRMRALIKEKLEFKKEEMSIAEGKKFFQGINQTFKVELISDLEKFGTTKAKEIAAQDESLGTDLDLSAKSDKISIYRTGKFVDLCRGPHVNNTSEIPTDSFKLDKIAGAFWRGKEGNPQMQRLYGLAFATKKELEEHLIRTEEAKKRDHKKLGPDLDLFVFSDLVGSGLPLWTPKGTTLRNILDEFVWQLRFARGYEKVEIPHITKKELYQKSGHWDKFQNELFKINTREGHEFAMKPMNCPHHTQIYDRRKWSYRELPQRYANTTTCYRDEQTGELSGLSRVRSFAQDDAHVFCRMSQAKKEFLKIWDIIHEFYPAFGFSLTVRLSRHDPKHMEKYLGDEKKWQQAEAILKDIIKEKKLDFIDGLGEAAFYGPKLDFMAKDSIGREWQVATIQLDMNMPDRFDLTCINEKGEPERIVMIHAAIMGSIERFLSIAIEHFAGAFPVWLSPVQIKILSITDKQNKYAQKVYETLSAHNLRVELDDRSETIGKKIREAEMQKIPYMLIVGEEETKKKGVSVRARKNLMSEKQAKEPFMKLEKFIAKVLKEITEKALS